MKYFIINTSASRRRFEPFPYSPDALDIELSWVQDSVEVLRAGNGLEMGNVWLGARWDGSKYIGGTLGK
jgi:hypothetical protein